VSIYKAFSWKTTKTIYEILQEILVFILLVQVLTTLLTLMQANHIEHASFVFCVIAWH